MEGTSVLVTDFGEGVCFSLMEFLTERKAVPYVLVKDFESLQEVYDNFPAAIPIVLDFRHSGESAIGVLSTLPTMSCVFNFDGETLENLYRQAFEHFHKTISTSSDYFDGTDVYAEMLEAISESYTLIVNFLSRTVSAPNPQPVETSMVKANPSAATLAVPASASGNSRNLKVVFEKLFVRHPEVLGQQNLSLRRKKDIDRRFAPKVREGNPISQMIKKMFTKFNPCSTISVLNLISTRSRGTPIKSPEEINKYIKSQETQEIKVAFQTIHESALQNWSVICEENFQLTPQDFEERFTAMCQEIERKGEEGRKVLLDNANKDVERTKQWDHVLGAKTIERLRTSREQEIELKVQRFCKRKIAEARQKVNDEIQEIRTRAKTRFYNGILDEQIMELMRIKVKYQKRKELLMLPYTGELKVLQ